MYLPNTTPFNSRLELTRMASKQAKFLISDDLVPSWEVARPRFC